MPKEIQFKADAAVEIFKKNPFDPRLKMHKLGGELEGYWAFRVDYQTRIVCVLLPVGVVILHGIGSHDVYDE